MYQNLFPQTARGALDIKANSFTIGSSFLDFPTGIRIEQLSSGKGLDLNLQSQDITLSDGVNIHSFNFSNGQPGNINVNSKILNISGFVGNRVSAIATFAFDTGKGGNLNFTVDNLNIDGGIIVATTFGGGETGQIEIDARQINITGNSSINDLNSGIHTSSFSQQSEVGDAGKIIVNTDSLKISRGGTLLSTSFSRGNAGSVFVTATDSIILEGNPQFNPNLNLKTSIEDIKRLRKNLAFSGVISSSVDTLPVEVSENSLPLAQLTGNAGSIFLKTPHLILLDNGIIGVANVGSGRGGTIEIQSEQITIDRASTISSSTVSGNGGNIAINSGTLSLDGNSKIDATVFGSIGNGGNITINTNSLFLLNNSTITANAIAGNGGNILINTDVLFQDPSSSITASSEFGVNGVVKVNSNVNLFIPTQTVNPNLASTQLSVDCTAVELLSTGELESLGESRFVARIVPDHVVDYPANGIEVRKGKWVAVRYVTADELADWGCELRNK